MSFTLSFSKLKLLLQSSVRFSERYLNPDYVDEPTEALIIGRAVHALLLEGQEGFDRQFVIMPEVLPAGYIADSMEALREHCAALLIKGGRSKAEIKQRIKDTDPDARFEDDFLADLRSSAEGRFIITQALFDKASEIAEAGKQCGFYQNDLSAGGWLFEQDVSFEIDGLPFRARLDAIHKTKSIVGELKVSAAREGEEWLQQIPQIMRRDYHLLQAAIYRRAHRALREKLGLPSGGAERHLWFFLTSNKPYEWEVVEIDVGSMAFAAGEALLEKAIEKYREMVDLWGEPTGEKTVWRSEQKIKNLEDSAFPPYFLQIAVDAAHKTLMKGA